VTGDVVGDPGSNVSRRWAEWRRSVDLDRYDARWQAMADRGEHVHGEADFVDWLLSHESSTSSRILDAGCGTGGVVIEVAREVPTLGCTGLETAWLPWLVARLRCAVAPNGARALRHDLWHYPLSSVDVLYAYLSPVPMGRLWDKACAEMASGSLFISNTFEVPGAAPETSVPVDDLTGAVLHLYRIPARATA